MAYKRYLGIDYGEARTGIAVSDLMGMTAQGVGTVSTRRLDILLEKVKGYAEEYAVDGALLGHRRHEHEHGDDAERNSRIAQKRDAAAEAVLATVRK